MNKVLAWYRYPEPRGTSYSEDDLKQPDKAAEVFDYCQILLAHISKSGWEFLASHYGFEKLFEFDNESGWHRCDSSDEYKLHVLTDTADLILIECKGDECQHIEDLIPAYGRETVQEIMTGLLSDNERSVSDYKIAAQVFWGAALDKRNIPENKIIRYYITDYQMISTVIKII